MDRLADDHSIAELYARHEQTLLRFFMERVRAPDLAADLTAETFAAALVRAARFDPAEQPELDWLLALARTQMLRAYREGEVDRAARERLRVPPVTLDARALDRVWRLRGPDRRADSKPRRSPGIVLAEPAQSSRAIAWSTPANGSPAVAPRPAARTATATSAAAATTQAANATAPAAGASPLAAAILLPGVSDSLAAAAARRHGGRRRRRRVVVGARIALAFVTVTWFVGAAVIPDRRASASSTVWLPFEAPHDIAGDVPQLWFHAASRQAPPVAGGRELLTITTYETGSGTGPRCGGVGTLGDADALVSILDRPGASTRSVPNRPEHFRVQRSAWLEQSLRACHAGLRVSWTPFRDGDRRLDALIVLGPRAGRRTEALALEVLDRVRLGPPATSPA